MKTELHSRFAFAVQSILCGLLVGSVALSLGCTSPATREEKKLSSFFKTPEWTKIAPWSKKDDEVIEAYPNPVKLAVTWTPDVLVQPGRTPTRGFGGRLFFFDEMSKAVPVEGTLTVHGFEGEGGDEQAKIRPFKFTPEQFTRHFSQSDFGASYSIWIPWEAAGGQQKRISLVATFESTSGAMVQGIPTTVVLPGSTQAQEQQQMAALFSPQYQNHRAAIDHHLTRPSGLATTTIHRRIGGPKQENAQSIAQRIESIVAKNRPVTPEGETPFVDLPLMQQPPTIMKASAELPDQTRPRRIRMPAN